jgi:hypothetical protein
VHDDGGSPQRARALGKGAFVSRALGERARALAHLEEACAIYRKSRFSNSLPFELANLCETLVDDGEPAAARAVQQELAASHPSPDAELRHLSAFTAAMVAELHGELGAAIAAVRLAIAAADEMAGLPDRREGRLLLARFLAAIGAGERVEPLLAEADALRAPDARHVLLPAALLRADARARQRRARKPARAARRAGRAVRRSPAAHAPRGGADRSRPLRARPRRRPRRAPPCAMSASAWRSSPRRMPCAIAAGALDGGAAAADSTRPCCFSTAAACRRFTRSR